jgi:elongation factor G
MRLEPVRFPEPVLVVSLEPEAGGDAEQLERAAGHLLREDPTLHLAADPNTGAYLLRGMGELHLEVFVERLAKATKRAVRLSKPEVAMWETITRTAGASAECRRQSAAGELVARVEVALVPRIDLGTAMVEDLVGPVEVGDPQRARMVLLEAMGGLLRTGLQQPFPARDLLLQLVTYSTSAPGEGIGRAAARGDAGRDQAGRPRRGPGVARAGRRGRDRVPERLALGGGRGPRWSGGRHP